jgi:hypothetical protein
VQNGGVVDIFEVTASDMSLDATWAGEVPALRLADLACQAESLLVLYAVAYRAAPAMNAATM